MSSTTPRAVGPYEVVRELGRGGMGMVLEVIQPDTGRSLALKLITGQPGEKALQRFEREAQCLARVQHPHVLRVYGFGPSPQGPFLLTDLVEGHDLEVCVKLRGAFPPSEAARIVRAVADAVVAVHAQGIVHRDLKPQNVILRPDGEPILLDFGLARDEHGERLTLSGAFLGTPAFMAPEQTGSRSDVGVWSDVYALGALLLYLLTGRPPYGDGLATPVIVKKLLTEEPIWPARDHPEVPAALDQVCRQAMARDPQQRFASAAALRDALDAFLAGQAGPAPASARGKGPLVAGASALVLTLVAGLALVAARREPVPVPVPGTPLPDRPRPLAVATDPTPAAPDPVATGPKLDGPLGLVRPLETAPGDPSLFFLGPDRGVFHAGGSKQLHLLTIAPSGALDAESVPLPGPAAALCADGEGRAIALLGPPARARVIRIDLQGAPLEELIPATDLGPELSEVLAWDPDSGVAACAGWDEERMQSTLLVRRPGGAPVRIEGVRGEVTGLALEPGGRRLLVGWVWSPRQDKGGGETRGGLFRYELSGPAPRADGEFGLNEWGGTGRCTSLAASPAFVAVGDSGTLRVHLRARADLSQVEPQPVAPDIAVEEAKIGDVPLGGFMEQPSSAHRWAVNALVFDGADRLWSVSGDEKRARNAERGNEVRVWDLRDRPAAPGRSLGGLVRWPLWTRLVAVDPVRRRVLLAGQVLDDGPLEVQLWSEEAFLQGVRDAPGLAPAPPVSPR